MKRDRTDFIVWHCTATRPSLDIGAAEIREWHLSRGWSDIGYAAVIRRNGRIEFGRPFDDVGAHVAGFNTRSVGVALVGGLDENGRSVDHRPDLFTSAQWISAGYLALILTQAYPGAKHVGHRDLSPDKNGDGRIEKQEWLKTCPGVEISEWVDRGFVWL